MNHDRSGPTGVDPEMGPQIEDLARALDENDLQSPSRALDRPARFGAYTLIEKIGSGGLANIYCARRAGLQGFVKHEALKIIAPGLGSPDPTYNHNLLVREARNLARLHHPHIARVSTLDEEGGQVYMALELIEGRSLHQILDRRTRLKRHIPADVAATIACALAGALHHIHGRGLLQGDFSPPNVMVGWQGDIKLIDLTPPDGVSLAFARPGYLSPEQVDGRALDARSDIFCLAICLYEMLTRRRLYPSQDPASQAADMRAARFAPARSLRPDIPLDLEDILMGMLVADPDKRCFQTAVQFERSLTDFLRSNATDLMVYRLAEFMRESFPLACTIPLDSVEAPTAPDLDPHWNDYEDEMPSQVIKPFKPSAPTFPDLFSSPLPGTPPGSVDPDAEKGGTTRFPPEAPVPMPGPSRPPPMAAPGAFGLPLGPPPPGGFGPPLAQPVYGSLSPLGGPPVLGGAGPAAPATWAPGQLPPSPWLSTEMGSPGATGAGSARSGVVALILLGALLLLFVLCGGGLAAWLILGV